MKWTSSNLSLTICSKLQEALEAEEKKSRRLMDRVRSLQPKFRPNASGDGFKDVREWLGDLEIDEEQSAGELKEETNTDGM
jgi:hypothetical protein